MDRRKLMPNRRAILDYWQHRFKWRLRMDVCWGCGVVCETQRCHIHAMQHGGHDEASNLVLLCRRCHYLQEMACYTQIGRDNFVTRMLSGLLFYDARKLEFDVVRALRELDAQEKPVEGIAKETQKASEENGHVSREYSKSTKADRDEAVLRARQAMMEANGGRAPGYKSLRAWMEEHGHKAPSFHRIRTIYKQHGLFTIY